MTYVLGKPIVTGRFRVTTISRQVVAGRVIGRLGIIAHCYKTLVFVLVDTPEDTIALNSAGAKVPLEDVYALCREAMEQMAA
jgi:hypothetical protein